MDEIISIIDGQVKIGQDDGNVMTVSIDSIQYPDPKIGDKVKIYRDGEAVFVTLHERYSAQRKSGPLPEGYKSIDKHLFVWVFSFLLGEFGIDRFMRGQIGCGVCKLLFNWATLFIWGLVDWIIATMKAYGTAFGQEEELIFDQNGKYIR